MARPKAKKVSRRTPRVVSSRRAGAATLDSLARAVRRLESQLEMVKRKLGRGNGKSRTRAESLRPSLRRDRTQETIGERWERLGILGAAKGLPPDLSTNPKYMEGFGAS